MIPTLYSIDPAFAKNHVHARWVSGLLTEIRSGLPEFLELGREDRVVIEGQFAGRNGGAVIKLAQAAGHAVGKMLRELDGVEWAAPRIWKRELCKSAAPKPALNTLENYRVHHVAVRLLIPEEWIVYDTALTACKNKSHRLDIVDAVGIGLWALGRTV